MKSLKCIIALIVFIFGISVFSFALVYSINETKNNPNPPSTFPLVSSEKLMSVVNNWRHTQGLKPYTKNDWLCEQAEKRVKEIQIDFSHNGFWNIKGDYRDLAENLSKDIFNEHQHLNGWLNSASHAANLKANYYFSCIRCENNYCVQLFANF